MGRAEIVDELAKGGVVEEILGKVAKRPVEGALKDLAQEVYLALLTYDEQKVCGMYERGELRWFISRIVSNQYNSSTSTFHYNFRRRYVELIESMTKRLADDGSVLENTRQISRSAR